MNWRGAILDALSTAPSHQLNTRSIARKLGVRPLVAFAACAELADHGAITRAYPGIRETPSDTTWRIT